MKQTLACLSLSSGFCLLSLALCEISFLSLRLRRRTTTTTTTKKRSFCLWLAAKGGTLEGREAEGKDPSLATLQKQTKSTATSTGEKFTYSRWVAGTWDIAQFTDGNGKVDWDAVIDAEVVRRKWLEDNPEASSNLEPVLFETSTVPWWAWVKRFHLPEAEVLNGRAAMLGYAAAYLVDSATGAGLVDQSNSFLGKLLLFITVVGVLLIRKNSDVANLRGLAQETTFYDKQWQATWKDTKDPEN
ncbi:unnamed protein product [Sphagnum troendelagicum]|uniref:Uncharacterized protein n=1 Tax=Sphagnum troendelagicum TaxID=128251 RepID=A0ABP0UN88_9BRYO